MAQPNSSYIKALAKGLQVIEVLAEAKSACQLRDLARALKQPKTSVFRLLFTLKEEGYVCQHPRTEAYQLTDRIAFFRRNTVEEMLRRTARPFLGRLLARFEQTVNLGMLDSGQVRYVEILEGLRSIRANPTVHTLAPIHATALGKVILAFVAPGEAKALLEAASPLMRYTPRTITSTRALLVELARTRKRGYAVDNEEAETGARCIAAPIFPRASSSAVRGEQGGAFAAISISGPVSLVRGEAVTDMAHALKQATGAISTQLAPLA